MEEQDQSLVSEARSGNQKAFEELVKKYQQKMFALAYKMTRNQEEAKDLTQEAFVRAYQGLPNFRGDSSFHTWLYQITMNLALNYGRRKFWKNFVSLFETKEPEANWGNPAEEFSRGRLSQEIDQAILSLPSKQRMVFLLRHYEELPYEEICKLTGTTTGALKASYFQAVRKLRRRLAHLR